MESSVFSSTGSFYSSLPQAKWWGDESLYQFKGYWFRLPHLKGIQQVLNHFTPLPTDVILASFPKTGTTWLKSLLYSIINSSAKQSLTQNHPHELVRSLELQVFRPHEPTNIFPSSGTRIFSTHMPYQLLSDHSINSSECRVVYVTRNPKDALTSLWHFATKSEVYEKEPWPIEVAVDKFCSGVVPYGPYYNHVLGYKKESLVRPQKIFFITYEELKNEPIFHVKKLAEFLGCPFDDEKEVEEIVKSCSIETLKKHEVNKSNESPSWFELPYNSFFRQGEVGDHKNYLNIEMIEHIDAITMENFHGSGFMFGM